MQILENYPLKRLHTFGTDVFASEFVEFENRDEAGYFLKNHDQNKQYFVLGGGSNLLFINDYLGCILYPSYKGVEVTELTDEFVYIKAAAGEVWDDFVAYCVRTGYYGIENLSHIPGNVGAVPVQNIGAFGVEVKDFIHEVRGIEISTGKAVTFSPEKCRFGYRYSVFKDELKDRFLITEVLFRLNRREKLVLEYGNLQSELTGKRPDAMMVRESIIHIRESRLPDPKDIGNAGSFFKNPVVDKQFAGDLCREYENMPVFPVDEKHVKLAAGWLIEKSGWKGRNMGNAGVYHKQALVLINNGKATGKEIHDLSIAIQEDVLRKFSVRLEPEVLIIY